MSESPSWESSYRSQWSQESSGSSRDRFLERVRSIRKANKDAMVTEIVKKGEVPSLVKRHAHESGLQETLDLSTTASARSESFSKSSSTKDDNDDQLLQDVKPAPSDEARPVFQLSQGEENKGTFASRSNSSSDQDIGAADDTTFSSAPSREVAPNRFLTHLSFSQTLSNTRSGSVTISSGSHTRDTISCAEGEDTATLDADDERTLRTDTFTEGGGTLGTDTFGGSPTTTLESPRSQQNHQEQHEDVVVERLLVEAASDSPSSNLRGRVPGGAAAKLMLLGPKNSNEEDTDTPSIPARPSFDTVVSDQKLQEIEITMNQAREEFERGRKLTVGTDEATVADASATGSVTPSFLNRNEIFHKTAAAAVAALLNPKVVVPEIGSTVSSHGSSHHDLNSSVSTSTSVFQAPTDGRLHTSSFHSHPRREVSDSLIKPTTERKLELLTKKMRDPTRTLTDLLTAIATPDDATLMDLPYMVRRKNACGALKVLTADVRKRIAIAWTVGVLPALTSVLLDVSEAGLEATFPDTRIREEYEAARNRAIQALLNLSIPKENRIPIFHTPDLIQALFGVIASDKGTARRGCTAILAYLAKTPDNRLLLAQIPGFHETMIEVLRPQPIAPEEVEPIVPKKSYHWDEDDEGDDASSSGSEHEEPNEKEDGTMDTTSRIQNKHGGAGINDGEMLATTRQNIFAILAHLCKERDNNYHFARDSEFLNTMVEITKQDDGPSHIQACKVLANMTRHRLNSKLMVFQERSTVPALVTATGSKHGEARLYAIYALQNLAQDKACRNELAMTPDLVSSLCQRARYSESNDERLAAISTLKNLCDEPANLIPLTNTQGCIATLMHLAHGREAGVTELMQYRACDALATLSHWLRKIATSGKSLETQRQGDIPDNSLFVPSLRVVTWNQWH